MAANNDRLEYIKKYYESQRVKIEFPAQISQTTQGKVIRRFNGVRAGVKFVEGFAEVDRQTAELFRDPYNFPNVIIHDSKEAK